VRLEAENVVDSADLGYLKEEELEPRLLRRLQLIEKRLHLVESEQKGGIDLSEFYSNPAGAEREDEDVPS